MVNHVASERTDQFPALGPSQSRFMIWFLLFLMRLFLSSSNDFWLLQPFFHFAQYIISSLDDCPIQPSGMCCRLPNSDFFFQSKHTSIFLRWICYIWFGFIRVATSVNTSVGFVESSAFNRIGIAEMGREGERVFETVVVGLPFHKVIGKIEASRVDRSVFKVAENWTSASAVISLTRHSHDNDHLMRSL